MTESNLYVSVPEIKIYLLNKGNSNKVIKDNLASQIKFLQDTFDYSIEFVSLETIEKYAIENVNLRTKILIFNQ